MEEFKHTKKLTEMELPIKATTFSRRVPTSLNPITGERFLNFTYMLLSDTQKRLQKLKAKKDTSNLIAKFLYLNLLRLIVLLETVVFEVEYHAGELYSGVKHCYRCLTRWWPQRRTRGFDDRELWNLDFTIVKFILTYLEPRLRAFKEMRRFGFPAEFQTQEEWNQVLVDILEGFKLIEQNENPYISMEEDEQLKLEQEQKMQKACQLFSKYWMHLWD